MKKKSLLLLFVAVCLILCIIPSLGMVFFASNETVGNEQETKLPSFFNEDKTFNQDYFEQMGTYFEKHFAFRPQIISVDAQIQSDIFKVSNLSSVVTGKDDYLFYSSTLDNYLGKNLLSDREIDSIAHNLKIAQTYVQANSAQFVFTVAPNKNSLYPQYMPYYYGTKVSDNSNIENLTKAMEEHGINYCELYSVFENNDEVLYLKQDSHWNNKGAQLAFDKIMTHTGKAHPKFVAPDTKTLDFMGDLSKMLYPKTQKPEKDYDYNAQFDFEYTNEVNSVEDPIIMTTSTEKGGSLYMYRDSFGNAILPFFASSYEKAYFTKAFPLNLGIEMLVHKPDTVVVELVERNLDWLLTMPPVIPSSQLTSYTIADRMDNILDINAEISMVNMSYIEVSGELTDVADIDCNIYVEVKDKNGVNHLFEAYHTSSDTSDYGYLVYINAADFVTEINNEIDINIITETDYKFTQIGSATVKVQEAQI